MKKLYFANVVLLVLFPLHGWAQEASSADATLASSQDSLALFFDEKDLVSIATGTLEHISRAPSVATVITAKEIEAMGARTLDEVLEYIPGVHVSRSVNRFNAIYSIRGIHTNYNPQVLFLINGEPKNDFITGARLPGFRLGVENISRIEVIRGPGSAVHGADALSGVINVITKDATDITGSVAGARVGSFDTYDTWVQHGDRYNNWHVALSLEHNKSNGDPDRIIDSDLQTIFDNLFTTNASLAPGSASTQYEMLNTSVKLSDNQWELWLNSWNLRNAGQGAGVAMALDPQGRQDADDYLAVLSYKKPDLAKHLGSETKVSIRRIEQQATFQLFPPNSLLLIGDDGNAFTKGGGLAFFVDGYHGNPGGTENTESFSNTFTYNGHEKHTIRFALGASHTQVTGIETKNFGPGVINGTALDRNNITVIDGELTDVSNTPYVFMANKSRINRFLSLQDEWLINTDWEFTAGIRHDHYSDFGDTTNPRLALVWGTTKTLVTKLLYGEAFRAPSATELYFKNNPSAIGNPDVKPETIKVTELVFDYRPVSTLESTLNLFKYQLKDLIDTKNGTVKNINNQDGYGVEIDTSWQASDQTRLRLNYAWQHSEDSRTGEQIANAPEQQLSLSLHQQVTERCALNPQANWVGKRNRIEADNRPTLTGYSIVDVTMNCHYANNALSVSAGVKNAFDTDAREPSLFNTDLGAAPVPKDYPLEGRSFFVGAAYHFTPPR